MASNKKKMRHTPIRYPDKVVLSDAISTKTERLFELLSYNRQLFSPNTATTNDAEIQQLLNDSNVVLNATGANGRNLMHFATAGNHVNVLNTLYNTHPELVKAKDKDELTPIHWAIRNGQIDSLATLYQRDSSLLDTNTTARSLKGNILSTKFPLSSIDLAVMFAQDDSLDWLLTHTHVDPEQDKPREDNYDLRYDTHAFHLAVATSNLTAIKKLAQHGVDTKASCTALGTPLHIAGKYSTAETMQWLLLHTPSPDVNALFTRYGFSSVPLKDTIESGLGYSRRNKSVDVVKKVKLLLEHGALTDPAPLINNGVNITPPSHYINEFTNRPTDIYVPIARMLIAAGTSPEGHNTDFTLPSDLLTHCMMTDQDSDLYRDPTPYHDLLLDCFHAGAKLSHNVTRYLGRTFPEETQKQQPELQPAWDRITESIQAFQSQAIEDCKKVTLDTLDVSLLKHARSVGMLEKVVEKVGINSKVLYKMFCQMPTWFIEDNLQLTTRLHSIHAAHSSPENVISGWSVAHDAPAPEEHSKA